MNEPLDKEETRELMEENPHLGIIDRHAETVSKGKLVLIVLCTIAIIVSFIFTRIEFGDLGTRITKIESPCLRYGSDSKQCRAAFGAALKSTTDYQLCMLLAQRPDLTGVRTEQCERIAREAKRRRAEVDGQSAPGSLDSQSPASVAGLRGAGNNAPLGGGASPSPDSDQTPNDNPESDQTPSSPPPTGNPTPPDPVGPPAPSNPSGPPAESEGPPPPESPSKPPSPIIDVKVPGLPVQKCAPGVLSINC